jgi:hypothetical protein
MYFGKYRRRADRGDTLVALYHGQRPGDVRRTVAAIDQYLSRCHAQRRERSGHGQQAGTKYVLLIDFFDTGFGHSPGGGASLDHNSQLIPALRFQAFRVPQSSNGPGGVQDDRGRYDGTCQGAPPRLIDARHVRLDQGEIGSLAGWIHCLNSSSFCAKRASLPPGDRLVY